MRLAVAVALSGTVPEAERVSDGLRVSEPEGALAVSDQEEGVRDRVEVLVSRADAVGVRVVAVPEWLREPDALGLAVRLPVGDADRDGVALWLSVVVGLRVAEQASDSVGVRDAERDREREAAAVSEGVGVAQRLRELVRDRDTDRLGLGVRERPGVRDGETLGLRLREAVGVSERGDRDGVWDVRLKETDSEREGVLLGVGRALKVWEGLGLPGDAEGLGVREEGVAVAEAEAVAEGVSERDPRDGDAEGDGLRERVRVGAAVSDSEGLGEGVSEGLADGEGDSDGVRVLERLRVRGADGLGLHVLLRLAVIVGRAVAEPVTVSVGEDEKDGRLRLQEVCEAEAEAVGDAL